MNIIYHLLYNRKIASYVLTFFITCLLFNSCKENPEELTIGNEFIESQTDLSMIDTFSVSISTVILDSVVTSGTGVILVGSYYDDVIGETTSNSYFQIGKPDYTEITDNETYDSLYLVIKYNQYFFGDTTKSQKISVHQLTENIKSNDYDEITGNTTFSYNPDPLGSIVYSPQPHNSTDSLAIRLNDITGRDLFTKLQNNSEILQDDEAFINYFHGLALLADDSYKGSIIGYKAEKENIKLVLYTSLKDVTTETNYYEFKLADSTKQFNNITHDFSSTHLSSLTKQQNSISSTVTGGMSFIQGGIGLMIRLDFPYLQNVLMFNRGRIAEAKLSISPSLNNYSDVELPGQLLIYESDKLNRFDENQSIITSASLILNELYKEESIYEFDMTDYLTYNMGNSYFDPEKGLLLSLPYDSQQTSFHRLILDAKNYKTKLKIYYLSY